MDLAVVWTHTLIISRACEATGLPTAPSHLHYFHCFHFFYKSIFAIVIRRVVHLIESRWPKLVNNLEVCVPKLILNKMRHHFPNWRYREKTNFFWSHCSRKSGNVVDICATMKHSYCDNITITIWLLLCLAFFFIDGHWYRFSIFRIEWGGIVQCADNNWIMHKNYHWRLLHQT